MPRFHRGLTSADMVHGSLAAALLALGGFAALAPARAAPPTVTPSPGYDARLQEQHAAQRHDFRLVHHPGMVRRHHVKRIHGRAY